MTCLPNQPIAVWVAALRSGEYEQAKGMLRDLGDEGIASPTWCCLGVATDVASELLDLEWGCGVLRDDCISYPPEAVEKLYGMDDVSNSGRAAMVSLALSLINDDMGYNFDQIADWIVEHTCADRGRWFMTPYPGRYTLAVSDG